MRLQELPAYYLRSAHQVLDLTADGIDLASQVHVAEGVYQRRDITEVAGLDIGPGAAVLALLGPASATHADISAIEPVLARMQPGARAILICGWPIEDTPYHRLLGPLSAHHCQVSEAVSLERTSIGAEAHCAIIVDRVEKLALPRAYLTEVGNDQNDWSADGADEFASLLRAVNECVLSDFVTRPLRRLVIEMETSIELQRQLAARERRVQQLEAQLARAERRLAGVQSSATYQAAQAMADGVRHPARAVATVPRDLVRIWRQRRAQAKRSPDQPTLP